MDILITGATSGLGLRTARAVADAGHTPVILGRREDRVAAVADELGGRSWLLDLRDLGAMAQQAHHVRPVDVVIANAAVQNVRSTRVTSDGWEETLVVNYLAHVALIETLLSTPTPPSRVVLLSSDTHDADRRTGTPPPFQAPLTDLADPRFGDGSGRVVGMRRYVTTKALATAYALGLAAERPDLHVTAYNPGLMPGTGLDRDHPRAFRAVWAVASRGMLALPFASTAARSARALASLAGDHPAPVPSGTYADFKLRPGRPSDSVATRSVQRAVLDETRELLATRVRPS